MAAAAAAAATTGRGRWSRRGGLRWGEWRRAALLPGPEIAVEAGGPEPPGRGVFPSCRVQLNRAAPESEERPGADRLGAGPPLPTG